MKKTILLAVLLGTVTMVYASGSHEGGHSMKKEQAHWAAPKDAAQQLNPVPSDSNSIEKGLHLFADLCARCHGDQALGDGPDGSVLSVKPTNLKAMAGGHPDGDFAWKIKNGRGDMPAWEDELEEKEIWHLVNYIQSLSDPLPAKKPEHTHTHN